MPVPILTVISQGKRATEIGEEILTKAEEILKSLGAEWSTEPTKRSPSMFRAISVFEPLDYDLRENGKKLEWGLGSAAPWVTTEVRGSELFAYIPDTPYYSCNFYVWRSSEAIVASPWWLLPAIAATSFEGLIIDDLYVWGVTAWDYSLNYKALHASVWRCPLGAILRVGPTEFKVMYGIDYSGTQKANPTELASLLVEGARRFLEVIAERGLQEVWVALSGGLDSRTVLSSLVKASENANVKVKAFTMQNPGTDPKEVEIAKEVAERIGVEHHTIDRREPNPSDEFRAILNPFRRTTMIIANGTGGDKTLSPLGHIKWSRPRNVGEMAAKLVKSHDYSVTVPPIHKHVRKARERIFKKLECEAQTPLELYRRYMLEYRMMNWLTSFNRPLISPFLYPRFFHESFKINPRDKNYFVLYAKVLEKLDRQLLQVSYYNLGCKLTVKSLLQKTKCTFSFALSGLRKLLKRQRGALVPTESAWRRAELLYREFSKIMPPVNHPIYETLENAVKWALEVRPRSARALSVTHNMLRLLRELATLNMAVSKST
ncbi:MAG: asparagine synthase-related protein [Candidatus Freyarchaeota archaeon]